MTRQPESQRFLEVVQEILKRHAETTLQQRWADAMAVGVTDDPAGYWIREGEDLINIVWLSGALICDITWFPGMSMSTFIAMRCNQVTGIEIREGQDAARIMGLPASGNTVVTLNANPQRAGLLWVARTGDEEHALRQFVALVASIVLR